MLKTFQVDYVRSALEFALMKNRGSEEYFDDNDFNIFSFYEHLQEEGEVQRYVEKYQTLIERQNRQELIGFGIVAVTDTPTIVNNKKCFISPFEWSCSIRITKENRDRTIATIYKIMEEYRGKKVDVACFDNGKLLPVGTVGSGNDMNINDYDFVGNVEGEITDIKISALITNLVDTCGFVNNANKVFIDNDGILKLFEYDTEEETWNEIENVVPNHTSYEKMKLDISFTDVKIDEPYTIDRLEYCDITFGGGATLTSANVRVGNDLIKVSIKKHKIVASSDGTGDFVFANATNYILDPLENGCGNSATSIENKLRSNYFMTNSHTDSVATTHEYTFIFDDENDLLNAWFEYASYGDNKLGTNNQLTQNSMTPNIIYVVKEIWNSWGKIKSYSYYAKIVEDIDIGNTDSDIMTIKVSMQLQGENN